MHFCFSQEIIGDFCQQFYETIVVGISLQWVVPWVISNQEAGTVILEWSKDEWCCENNRSWMEKNVGGGGLFWERLDMLLISSEEPRREWERLKRERDGVKGGSYEVLENTKSTCEELILREKKHFFL